jgi:protein-disulfide isomerase
MPPTISQPDLTVPVTHRDHTFGPVDAPLLLVMYGDYECPYTAMAHELIQELQDALDDRLCFVYRNFPLWDIHPHALPAAMAAETAASQGRFWEMHHQLFTHQEELDNASLLRHATAVGLNPTRFAAGFHAQQHADRVQEDLRSGEASGVHSTPTFFLNGRRHREKFNLQALVQEIFDVPGVDPS